MFSKKRSWGQERRYTIDGFMLEKRGLLALFLAATVLMAVVAPLKSYIMQWLIDAGDRDTAIRALALGLGIVLLSHVTEYVCRASFVRIACKSVEQIRCQIVAAHTGRPMQELLAEDTGRTLSTLTNDIKIIEDEYYMGIFNIFFWGSMAAVSLAMLAVISLILLPLGLVMCVIPMIVPKLMAKKLSEVRGGYSADMADYTSRTGELLKGYEALAAAGAVGYFIQVHSRAAARNQEKDYGVRRMANLASIATSLSAWVPNLLILFFTVLLIFGGYISIGTLVTVNSLANFVIGPARQVANSYVGLKSSYSIKEKLEAAMNCPAGVDGGEETDGIEQIDVRRLTFSYPGADRPALRDVSFTIGKNEKTAIVGPSGSGKSTIAKILYRYYSGYTGSVHIGRQDLAHTSRRSYYRRVSMIPQTPFIFSDSIYNNICLYQTYGDGEVRRAIAGAGLTDYVEAQPVGWDTLLAESGRSLSGGQMQRIAIARAILRKSDVILVDEATSSLDAATTSEVMKNLLDLDCTVIAITHDIFGDYMQKFDCIYYLAGGELQEHGSFDALLRQHGKFARLYENLSGETDSAP